MSKEHSDHTSKRRGFKIIAIACMMLGLISSCSGGLPAFEAITDWLDPRMKMLNPTAEQAFREGMMAVPIALVAIATGVIAYTLADLAYGRTDDRR
jgi:hypothetical protein